MTLQKIWQKCKRGYLGRIASIDYGLARMGVALSDPLKMIASAKPTIQVGQDIKKSAQQVIDVLSDQDVELIVVGLPLNMNGTKGAQALAVEHFVENLRTLTEIPIITWDERLTTVQAERMLNEGSMSRKKRSKAVDAVAALLILQSYLDSQI